MGLCGADDGRSACCNAHEDGFGNDGDCEVFNVGAGASTLSDPVRCGRGYVCYTTIEADSINLVRKSLTLDGGDLTVPLPDLDLMGINPLSPPMYAAGSTVIVAADRVLSVDTAGTVAVRSFSGTRTGAPAFCSDGTVWVATEQNLLEIDSAGNEQVLGVAAGKLDPALGPIVHTASHRIILPVQGGAAAAFLDSSMKEHALLGMMGSSELPGGLLGMALEQEGMAFLVSRGGTVRGVDLAIYPLDTNNWSSSLQDDDLVAGPILISSTHLAVAGASGNVYLFSQAKRHQPGVAATVPGIRALVPLQWNGFALMAQGAQGGELVTAVDHRSFPWLPEWFGLKLTFSDRLCNDGAIASVGQDGVLVVRCGDQLTGLIIPEVTPVEAPWPTPRGPGRSGCL